jgi:membrane-associated phospholipid phosphatase
VRTDGRDDHERPGDGRPGDGRPGDGQPGDRRLIGGRPVATVAVVVACGVVVAVLGGLVAGQAHAMPVDRAVDGWISARLAAHQRLVTLVVESGDPQRAVIICAVLVAAALAFRRWRGALLVLIGVPLASGLTEVILKHVIDRTWNGDLMFPSGHVTGTSAMATAALILLLGPAALPLPVALRWVLAVVAVAAVLAVAVGVIALHYHYFTDTIGGAATGTGTVLATALALDVLARLAARRRAASGHAAPDDFMINVR